MFIENLKGSVDIRKRKNKEPKQTRYLHYMTWAIALRKKQIGSLDNDEAPNTLFLKLYWHI